MTPTKAKDPTRPILRTTDGTANEIRALASKLGDARGGRRVTQDQLIAALAWLGRTREGELLAYLDRAPK